MSSNINDYEDISNIKIKDIDNISYFIYKNNFTDNIFSDDELDNLNSTFMKIIQTYSDMYGNAIDSLDFVYQNVIDYYANGQYDDAIILMNSIFNTQLTTSVTTNCGCNSQSDCTSVSSGTSTINTGTDLVSLDTATCADKYKAAMYQWLIQMLSDINFYCNWMFTTVEDEDNITIPDEELIDRLMTYKNGYYSSKKSAYIKMALQLNIKNVIKRERTDIIKQAMADACIVTISDNK